MVTRQLASSFVLLYSYPALNPLHDILLGMCCLVFVPQKHRIGLKGPMTTPIGKGFRSLNLTLRKVRMA